MPESVRLLQPVFSEALQTMRAHYKESTTPIQIQTEHANTCLMVFDPAYVEVITKAKGSWRGGAHALGRRCCSSFGALFYLEAIHDCLSERLMYMHHKHFAALLDKGPDDGDTDRHTIAPALEECDGLPQVQLLPSKRTVTLPYGSRQGSITVLGLAQVTNRFFAAHLARCLAARCDLPFFTDEDLVGAGTHTMQPNTTVAESIYASWNVSRHTFNRLHSGMQDAHTLMCLLLSTGNHRDNSGPQNWPFLACFH